MFMIFVSARVQPNNDQNLKNTYKLVKQILQNAFIKTYFKILNVYSIYNNYYKTLID